MRPPSADCGCGGWSREGKFFLRDFFVSDKANIRASETKNVGAFDKCDENVTTKYLREQVREAVGTPAKQNIVKRLNFCMWTEQAERWIDMAIWEEGSHVVDAAQLKDRKCLGGLADPFYVKAIRIAVVIHGLGANTPKK
jgi:hypothetical protein